MIPVNEPLVTKEDQMAVADAVASGWISSAGSYLDRFEKEWASACSRRHGIAVTNGTAALEAAVAALGIGPGDEVIVPSFTIVSCANAVLRWGARPVFVDVEKDTWCIDPEQVKEAVGPKTKALMPVHMYGHPAAMDELTEIASDSRIQIIEDAAQAHGALYKGQVCGSFGDVSCFSFYANKIITTGEGGMVLTDDDRIASRLRSVRNLAFEPKRRFYHRSIGCNLRMTNIQAALGVSQIERLPQLVERKREIARRYLDGLDGTVPVKWPAERPDAQSVYWMFGGVLDEDLRLDSTEWAARLHELGVETRPFFFGLHEQPVFRDMGIAPEHSLPITERLARKGLYLPSGLTITDDQIAMVIGAVKESLS